MAKTKNTILLNRSILNWGWYKDTNTARLFIHLLLRVNWEDKVVNGITIKRGQLLTSIDSLRYETGMTTSQIRTCITKLTNTSEIASTSTSKYRIVTVLKYDEYQYSRKQVSKQVSSPVANKIAPNNKDNQLNLSNQLNNKDIYRSFDHLELTQKQFNKLIKDGYTKDEIDSTMDSVENYAKNKNYKSLNLTIRSWIARDRKKKPQEHDTSDYDSL